MIAEHPDFRTQHDNEGWRRRRAFLGGYRHLAGLDSEERWRSCHHDPQGNELRHAGPADYGTAKKESFVSLLLVAFPTVTSAHDCRVPNQLVENIVCFDVFIEARLRLA